MKRITKFFGVLLVALFLFGCSSTSSELTKVKVGDLRSEFWLPLYVAKEKGFFEEQGLDVELVMFKDGPVALQSALNGEVDYSVLSTEPVLIAFDQGMKSTITMATLKNKPFMIVANKSIKSIEDLKGKKIVAGTPGSSPYAFVSAILKKHGLDPQKDVELINMDYGASLAALDNNQIQGTFLDATRINQSDLNNINVLIDLTDPKTHKEIYGTEKYEASIVVASQDFVKNNPETNQKFANAMLKAMRWQQENDDKAIAEAIAPLFEGLDMVDIISLTRSSLSKDGLISEEGFEAISNFVYKEGLVKNKIAFDDVIDLSFIKQAANEIK